MASNPVEGTTTLRTGPRTTLHPVRALAPPLSSSCTALIAIRDVSRRLRRLQRLDAVVRAAQLAPADVAARDVVPTSTRRAAAQRVKQLWPRRPRERRPAVVHPACRAATGQDKVNDAPRLERPCPASCGLAGDWGTHGRSAPKGARAARRPSTHDDDTHARIPSWQTSSSSLENPPPVIVTLGESLYLIPFASFTLAGKQASVLVVSAADL